MYMYFGILVPLVNLGTMLCAPSEHVLVLTAMDCIGLEAKGPVLGKSQKLTVANRQPPHWWEEEYFIASYRGRF